MPIYDLLQSSSREPEVLLSSNLALITGDSSSLKYELDLFYSKAMRLNGKNDTKSFKE